MNNELKKNRIVHFSAKDLDQSDFHHSFITTVKSKYSLLPIQMGYMIFRRQMEKEIRPMNRQHLKEIALGNASENYPEVVSMEALKLC